MTISSFLVDGASVDACDVVGDAPGCWAAAGSVAANAALAPHNAMTETPAQKNAQLAACDRLPLIRLSPPSPPAPQGAGDSVLRKFVQLCKPSYGFSTSRSLRKLCKSCIVSHNGGSRLGLGGKGDGGEISRSWGWSARPPIRRAGPRRRR